MSKPRNIASNISIKPDTVLNFGKYKGCTAIEVLSLNPNYIIWLETETNYNVDATLVNAAVDLASNATSPFEDDIEMSDF